MEEGFIAYIGTELDEKDLKGALASVASDLSEEEDENYRPRIRKSGDAIFGQIIISGEDLEKKLREISNNT